ncbi:ABC transporter permease [Mucilaginibacter ginsenosidivorax]|uniref:FtsX-like permease family protein n=1 Tax=Mucilaginibacter ginsenosidivorax TaxID=862126 RepID=A0A5B8W1L6_9SPHI|nr:ABC transporter permease [Mucilaginibacter ginsenosidivorax]QEC77900.1 FtsX-like permease family protein [Mucilaginibacter ginsenosidivorax]
MLKNFIKTAFRSLLKNKGFTTINILGLALGLATCLLIVFYVVDELSYDRFNSKANRIYRVNMDLKYGGNVASFAITPPPLAATLAGNFPEVEKCTRLIHDQGIRVKKGNEFIQEEKVVYAEPDLFNVFTLPLVAGDAKTALTAPNTAVITESTAKRYFNSTDAVGKTLTLSNNTNYKITGVMRDIPNQSHFKFDFFLSIAGRADATSNDWNNFSYTTYILFKPGADPKKLEAKLPALMKKQLGANYQQLEKSGGYFKLNIMPLTDIHLKSNRQYELGANSSITYVYIFSAIALFVLLIACINFMNMSTARSANRAREVGVRKVLGSSRAYLIAQFLSESLLVTIGAAIIAVLAAWALLPLFNQVAGKQLMITGQTFAWLLPSLLAIVVVVGVLAGSYPAFYLSAFQPISVLKGKVSSGFKGGMFRNILVVFQFAISIFLIIGTLVIYNQLTYIQHKDLGFDRTQVLVVKNVDVLQSAQIFKQEVAQIPGVKSASLSGFLPTGVARQPDAVFRNKIADPKNALFTEVWPIDEDYLTTMGMGMSKGRGFSRQFATDSAAIVINETAARMLGYGNNALDKKLYRPSGMPNQPLKEFHVIGVVKDFNFSSLRDNITPVVMLLSEDKGALSIKTNNKNMTAFVAQVQSKWNTISPNQHFEYSFMDQDFNATYRTEQRTGALFLSFTTLAVIIACLGLFSLAAYAAEQRNKEIGIRKVLGASASAIVTMLSKDFIKLVLISFAIAAPLAWLGMRQWLQGFAYRQNIQWWVIVLSGLGAIVIAFVTISAQSFKAAMSNPVDSLKDE